MDEILRRQLLNDLVLLEKAYEKGRGSTKGCEDLGDLQQRVTTARRDPERHQAGDPQPGR